MADNNKYQPNIEAARKIEKILSKQKTLRKWVVDNNLGEYLNSVIKDMKDSQTKDEYDALYRQLQDRILIPFYNGNMKDYPLKNKFAFFENLPFSDYELDSKLGNYDQLAKNAAFAGSRFKKYGLNPYTGKEEDFLPLPVIARDPYELDKAAYRLGISPDKLKEYIEKEFAKKQKDFVRSVQEKAYDKIAKDREELAKSPFGSNKGLINKIGNVFGEVFLNDAMQSAQRAIRNGEDPKDIWNALAKDFGVTIASLAIPSLAGGALTKTLANKGWTLGTRIASDALAQGAIDGLIEFGRQGLSNYDDMDPMNAWRTAYTSATLPALANGAFALASHVPAMARYISKMGQRLKGNLLSPVDAEADAALNLYDEARNFARMKDRPDWDDFVHSDRFNRLYDYMKATTFGPDEMPDYAQMINALNNDHRMFDYFIPPNSKDMEALKAMYKRGGSEAKKAEDILEAMNTVWPNTVANLPEVLPSRKERVLANIVNSGTYGAARYETAKQRAGSEVKGMIPSPELEEIIENDPTMIKAWDSDMFTRDGSGKPIPEYLEYKRLKSIGAL